MLSKLYLRQTEAKTTDVFTMLLIKRRYRTELKLEFVT